MMLVIKLFQFHKGTIKTTKKQVDYYAESNFNSIKVRLKHWTTGIDYHESEISIP